LISTLAPASSNFFLIASASSFGHAFLDRLRRAFDQVLGFLQPRLVTSRTDLDDVDLVAADIGQDDVNSVFSSTGAAGAAPAIGHHHRHRCRRRHAKLGSSALTSCDSSITLMPLM
jgi:hypothetical protein